MRKPQGGEFEEDPQEQRSFEKARRDGQCPKSLVCNFQKPLAGFRRRRASSLELLTSPHGLETTYICPLWPLW